MCTHAEDPDELPRRAKTQSKAQHRGGPITTILLLLLSLLLLFDNHDNDNNDNDNNDNNNYY